MKPGHAQSGYMMEVPLIMLAAGVVLAIALPRVPPAPGKALMVVGTLIWIGGLYYMFLAPGWQPGGQSRLRRVSRWVLFLTLAGFLVFIAGAYVCSTGATPS